MRNYRPDTAELVRTVAEFLGRLAPTLGERDRYEALVCSHILSMIERELAADPLADLDEVSLAAAIRRGAYDDDWEAVLAATLERTIERVRLAKPDHLVP